jgi:hypothetical protein
METQNKINYSRTETETLRKFFIEHFVTAEGLNNGLWYCLKEDCSIRFKRNDAIQYLKQRGLI